MSAPRRPWALMLGTLLLAAPALAQETDSVVRSPGSSESLKMMSLEQLMSVEVTSVSRRPERLSHAASAIQVVTREDILRSGATSLPEALRLAPNLHVAQIDSRQWAIGARGFNGTTTNKLLVLIDGRVVYSPLFSGVFWDVQDVNLGDVDRIEVISGPGATLWGANAVNGVINVVTRSAAETRGGRLVAAAGTELPGYAAARYGGSLGPTAQYRVYARGFARDPAAAVGGNDFVDDWRMAQGGFRTDWDVSARSRLTFQGDIYGGRIGQPAGSDIDVGGGNVLARWGRTLSNTSSLSIQAYFDRTRRDIPGTLGDDTDTYDLELQHRMALGRRHDVVWGIGYRLITNQVFNGPQLAFLPSRVRRDWITGFVQDEIALTDRLQLTLGSKIEHNDYTGLEFQPSARISFAATKWSQLWTSVGRALRTPSRIDRELFAPGQPPFLLAGGAGFESEENLAYELGYRVRKGPLGLSMATFYSHHNRLRSLEQVNPPDSFPLVIGNGQEGEAYGAEVTADYRVTDGWRLGAGYSGVRVQIWAQPWSTDTSAGSAESAAPEHQLFLRSSLDLSAVLRFHVGLRYVSEIANQGVPSYAEADARLTWQPTPHLDLSLTGQNLLHARHAEFGRLPSRREIRREVFGSAAWRF